MFIGYYSIESGIYGTDLEEGAVLTIEFESMKEHCL